MPLSSPVTRTGASGANNKLVNFLCLKKREERKDENWGGQETGSGHKKNDTV